MSNTAAVLTAAKTPLEIQNLPIPVPNDGEVLIKNTAIGLNPIDGKVARWAIFPIKYPAILGTTVAGTVQESKNPRFKTGDRVMTYLPWYFTGDNRQGGFQKYSVAVGPTIAKIPDHLSFEKASSFPMNSGIAAGALFKILGLEQPTDWRNPKPNNKTILLWGGSTSVGGYAIQLAVMAGYKVITTASPHNFEYVRSLGAAAVYDRSDPSSAAAIAAHAPFAGILDNAGVPESLNAILEVLKIIHAPNPPSGVINTLLPVMVEDPNWPETVTRPQVLYNTTAPENREFADWLWSEGGFFETVLEEGGLRETPVEVIGGLEKIDWGLDEMLKGVSAKKLVVVV